MLLMYILLSKSHFLEFWLLLGRLTPCLPVVTAPTAGSIRKPWNWTWMDQFFLELNIPYWKSAVFIDSAAGKACVALTSETSPYTPHKLAWFCRDWITGTVSALVSIDKDLVARKAKPISLSYCTLEKIVSGNIHFRETQIKICGNHDGCHLSKAYRPRILFILSSHLEVLNNIWKSTLNKPVLNLKTSYTNLWIY